MPPLPTFLLSYLPSYLPSILPSNLPSFFPTFLPSFLPFNLLSYLPSFHPTFLPSYLPSILPSLPLSCLSSPCPMSARMTVIVVISAARARYLRPVLSLHRPSAYLLRLPLLQKRRGTRVGQMDEREKSCFCLSVPGPPLLHRPLERRPHRLLAIRDCQPRRPKGDRAAARGRRISSSSTAPVLDSTLG